MENLNDSQLIVQSRNGEKSLTVKTQKKTMISMLLNSIHYFLDCVVIIHTNDRYRLLVFHSDNILFDQQYTTLKGAKIAFHQIYKNQTCINSIKARWDEYFPEPNWIKKKMEILERKEKMHV